MSYKYKDNKIDFIQVVWNHNGQMDGQTDEQLIRRTGRDTFTMYVRKNITEGERSKERMILDFSNSGV
jgi:hypothetical protein